VDDLLEKRRPEQVHLSSALTASFSPGQVRYGRDDDAIDGLVPAVAITVRSLDDIVTVVQEAKRSGLALVPTGTGSLLSVGNKPKAYDVRVSLTGMASILERCPDDMTVTVEPGVGIGRLNRLLAADGQRVAIDCAGDQQATIGGRVATNTTGGYAYGFGTPRDLVLGLTVVDGRGRVLRTGARVVKNVAGYDLPRLFTGSYGTLGIIAEVTLRTHPLPPDAVTACFDFSDASELEKARTAICASELPLVGIDFEARELNRWRLLARMEGTEEQLDYQTSRLAELCRRRPVERTADWQSPIHAEETATDVIRAGALPSRVVSLAMEILQASRDVAASVRVAGRLGDGLLRVFAQCERPQDSLRVMRLVGERAAAVVERMPTPVKSTLDVWGQRPVGFELMRGIKQAFDPFGLLSPGRFVGGL